jgi:hypothetical protein
MTDAALMSLQVFIVGSAWKNMNYLKGLKLARYVGVMI